MNWRSYVPFGALSNFKDNKVNSVLIKPIIMNYLPSVSSAVNHAFAHTWVAGTDLKITSSIALWSSVWRERLWVCMTHREIQIFRFVHRQRRRQQQRQRPQQKCFVWRLAHSVAYRQCVVNLYILCIRTVDTTNVKIVHIVCSLVSFKRFEFTTYETLLPDDLFFIISILRMQLKSIERKSNGSILLVHPISSSLK